MSKSTKSNEKNDQKCNTATNLPEVPLGLSRIDNPLDIHAKV